MMHCAKCRFSQSIAEMQSRATELINQALKLEREAQQAREEAAALFDRADGFQELSQQLHSICRCSTVTCSQTTSPPVVGSIVGSNVGQLSLVMMEPLSSSSSIDENCSSSSPSSTLVEPDAGQTSCSTSDPTVESLTIETVPTTPREQISGTPKTPPPLTRKNAFRDPQPESKPQTSSSNGGRIRPPMRLPPREVHHPPVIRIGPYPLTTSSDSEEAPLFRAQGCFLTLTRDLENRNAVIEDRIPIRQRKNFRPQPIFRPPKISQRPYRVVDHPPAKRRRDQDFHIRFPLA